MCCARAPPHALRSDHRQTFRSGVPRRGTPSRKDVQFDRRRPREDGLPPLCMVDGAKSLCCIDGRRTMQSGCNRSSTFRLQCVRTAAVEHLPVAAEVRSRAGGARVARTVQFRSGTPLAARVHPAVAIGSELAASCSVAFAPSTTDGLQISIHESLKSREEHGRL